MKNRQLKVWRGSTAAVRAYLQHDQSIAPAQDLTEHGEHLATMFEVSREVPSRTASR